MFCAIIKNHIFALDNKTNIMKKREHKYYDTGIPLHALWMMFLGAITAFGVLCVTLVFI